MSGTQTILIGDIGGTHARFALVDARSGDFHSPQTLSCIDFETAHKAIECYLEKEDATVPDVVCLAAAGPLIGNKIDITNNHWDLCSDDLRAQTGARAIRLVNDFEAIAHSITLLPEGDCLPIGHASSHKLTGDYSVAIVGPGTGFGVAGLLSRNGVLQPIVGEGGHAAFAAKSSLQIAVLRELMERFESVSLERLVSGPGVENLFSVLAEMSGAAESCSASEIFSRAQRESDSVAADTIDLFFEVLGQVAADVVLTLGAVDGLYIAGGITKRYSRLLRDSKFRRAFENVGSHRALMASVPTYLITHEEPGLLGAAAIALQAASTQD